MCCVIMYSFISSFDEVRVHSSFVKISPARPPFQQLFPPQRQVSPLGRHLRPPGDFSWPPGLRSSPLLPSGGKENSLGLGGIKSDSASLFVVVSAGFLPNIEESIPGVTVVELFVAIVCVAETFFPILLPRSLRKEKLVGTTIPTALYGIVRGIVFGVVFFVCCCFDGMYPP